MQKKSFLIVVSVVIIFLFQFCSGEENKEVSEYYSLDSVQVASVIPDFNLGIEFKSPQNWKKRAAEISSKVETKGIYDGHLGQFVYEPSYLFFDDSTLSVLAMGKIVPPDSLVENSNILNLYAQALSATQKNKQEYTVDQFEKDNIRFTIFTINRANIISKRLIFQNKFNDIIQFEYTTRADAYQSEEEKIKQSIGSIGLL